MTTHTMKQEKTMPRGVEPVSSTGVQRKTKMYMQDSSRDWTVPSNRTFSSLKMILSKRAIRLQLRESSISPPETLHTGATEVFFPISIILLPSPEGKS